MNEVDVVDQIVEEHDQYFLQLTKQWEEDQEIYAEFG